MEENTSPDFVWNYGNNGVTTGYSQLFNNPIMSDFTFRVVSEDTVVPGHKFIMSLCSWDYYNIFNFVKLDNYELIIEDVSLTSFLTFLEYCYTMKVNLSDDIIFEKTGKTLEVLKLAQIFHMVPLVKICEDHIKSNISEVNCMMIFKNKDVLSPDSAASNEMMKKIEGYFWRIIRDQSSLDIFVDLALKDLREITRDPLLNCDEIEVFGVLMKWAKRNCEKKGFPSDSVKNLRLILRDVFYEIRFPSMPIDWFTDILAKYPGMFTHDEISNICNYINHGQFASLNYSMGFKCNPREPVFDFSSAIPFGQTLPTFSEALEMDKETSDIRCEIQTSQPRNLLGFAFFAKKGETVNVTSCRWNYPSYDGRRGGGTRNYWTDRDIIPSGKCRFSKNFDLIIIRFKNPENLNEVYSGHKTYILECNFNKKVPSVKGSNELPCGTRLKAPEMGIPFMIFKLDS